jgi:enoyl-[acyl-carrier protein] reductase I
MVKNPDLMMGKRGVIFGVANNRSIYLLSDLSRDVTGEAHHVDSSGSHVVGMKRTGAPDISLAKD